MLTSRMTTAQKIDQRDAEVTRWRFEELRRAGWDAKNALIVAAEPEIDLHLAVTLLRRGCPSETALRILL